MKLQHLLLPVIAAFLVIASSCAKQIPPIGRGDVSGEFQQCVNLSLKGKYEESIQCLEMFKARYPKTPEGQEAELKIGDAQFQKKEYLLAAESYLAFLRLYPNHPKADYAHYRAGVAYYKESPKAIDRDQAYLTDAIEHLRTVLKRYPHSAYSELSRATLHVALRRIARRHMYVGKFYYRTGEYIAAIPRFKEVADNFPDSGLADEALFKMIDADIELGKLDDAKDAYSALQTQYPDSKYTKKAESKLLRAAKK